MPPLAETAAVAQAVDATLNDMFPPMTNAAADWMANRLEEMGGPRAEKKEEVAETATEETPTEEATETAEAPAEEAAATEETPTETETATESEKPAETKPPTLRQAQDLTAQPTAQDNADAAKTLNERRQAEAQWAQDFAGAEKLVAEGKIDPVENPDNYAQDVGTVVKVLANGMKQLKDGMEEMRGFRDAVAQERVERGYWDQFEETNPDIGKRGRTIWKEEQTKAAAEGLKGPEAHGFAIAGFKHRLATIRGKAKTEEAAAPAEKKPAAKTIPANAPRKPPVTRGGAGTVPTTSARPPAPPPQTFEEMTAHMARTLGPITAILNNA